VKRERRVRREVKIDPQLTQWRLDPAPGPHHVMWATLAGTSGLREPSSLTWKSGIAEMVQSARAARKCNGQAKPASKAARISAVEEEESRRREWPTVEICAALSPPIRRRQSSLSTPHRAVEVVAAASATSQIGCKMVACEVIASRDGQA
jgi:hypothetical protein